MPGDVLVRSGNRTIDEDVLGHVAPIGLEAFPKLPPEAPGSPASKLESVNTT